MHRRITCLFLVLFVVSCGEGVLIGPTSETPPSVGGANEAVPSIGAANEAAPSTESAEGAPASLGAATAVPPFGYNPRLYGHIYWENGYPGYTFRRPKEWRNQEALENPDLVIQTGYYRWRLAVDDMSLTGYNSSWGTDYVTSFTESPRNFSSGALLLRAYKDDIAYTARSGLDSDGYGIRLIENGQYVQRFDLNHVVFSDSSGNILDSDGYVEITAWADRIVYTLDFSDDDEITRTTIRVTSQTGEQHTKDQRVNKLSLAIKPSSHTRLSPMTSSHYITEAYETDSLDPVDVSFDEDEYALRFDLKAERLSYPADIDRYDEYTFTITNPLAVTTNIPIVFNQLYVPAVTGTSMQLVDGETGQPTGIPVQIGKNWHKTDGLPTKHDATDRQWLRGATMLTVKPGVTKTLRLRVAYGYWDQAGAVSHSALSLIGYRQGQNNWKWDESALGAWGETATYSPAQELGAAFISDVRPVWTTPKNGTSTSHAWTENVGGGDFLKYFDSNGDYHWGKELKTLYRWAGPNIADVRYSGITDDEKIRFTYTTQLVRSNDYDRRFYTYKYEILEEVKNPSRFVYFQMAADSYQLATFNDFYTGGIRGDVSVNSPVHGGNAYTGEVVPFNRSWLAVEDTETTQDDTTATRGLIWISSTLNGEEQDVYLHQYGSDYQISTTLFDLSGESVTQTYNKGDVIEGTVMQLLPAKSAQHYWGADSEFAGRLADQTGAWQQVQNEFLLNIRSTVFDVDGVLVNDYPVIIDASLSNDVLQSKFIIKAGKGIGHIPVIIKNAPAGLALNPHLRLSGTNVWQSAIQNPENIDNHAFYQAYVNSDGTVDYAFNIIRPEGSLDKYMRVGLKEY